MAVEGFATPGGAKETMVANISTTTRFPVERADNATRPPMTREPWDEDDEPAPPPPPPPAPVTISKARTPLRDALEAQLAAKRAQSPGGGTGGAPRGNPAVSHTPSAMRMQLEAELMRRQGGAPPMRPRVIHAGGGGGYDPPEGVGSGAPPPGGGKVR